MVVDVDGDKKIHVWYNEGKYRKPDENYYYCSGHSGAKQAAAHSPTTETFYMICVRRKVGEFVAHHSAKFRDGPGFIQYCNTAQATTSCTNPAAYHNYMLYNEKNLGGITTGNTALDWSTSSSNQLACSDVITGVTISNYYGVGDPLLNGVAADTSKFRCHDHRVYGVLSGA